MPPKGKEAKKGAV
jgi:hypothetical protein